MEGDFLVFLFSVAINILFMQVGVPASRCQTLLTKPFKQKYVAADIIRTIRHPDNTLY